MSACRAPGMDKPRQRDGLAALPRAPLDYKAGSAALDVHQAGRAGIGGFGANGVLGFCDTVVR